MSGLSLSHYSLHLTSTSTFDAIFLYYLYHTMTTSDIYYHVWRHMPRVSLSHYRLHRKYQTTFEDKYLDILYHTITYIWNIQPRLTTYARIIIITQQLTSDIYYHVWRHISGISFSQYGLHLIFTTTFDCIYLDYFNHTMGYTWHLLPRLTTYVCIILITL
jgi:hypothetical protein